MGQTDLTSTDILKKYWLQYDNSYEIVYDTLPTTYVRNVELCPDEMIKKESGNIIKNYRCVSAEPIVCSNNDVSFVKFA